ncbi:UGSC family (seleno)protein [Microbacterium sp.]|jgi:hypothetical protein|uniref:UGSC family (seleno)protein n=1 Tax=Microbacterium sp. TaxID=51671 RepID=UPI002CC215DF|nr:UGSC family (seleno)protein [Microbacterium sp.]HWL78702.1 UGSC family (seleno)protein [Microbacterium sp.]
MASTIASTIIDPTVSSSVSTKKGRMPRAARAASLAGVRVGLLENTKRNAADLLDGIGEALVRDLGAAELVRKTKKQFALPLTAEVVAELSESCDVVVVGVGDCGSCSAAAVADGIALERAGIPTAVICTEAFASTSQAMAELKGDPDFPYILTEHPVANLDAGQLVDRAAHLVPDVVARLTAPASASAQSAADSALSVPV